MHRKHFRKAPSKSPWRHCRTTARRLMFDRAMTYADLARAVTERGLPVSFDQVVRVVHGLSRRPDLRAAIAAVFKVSEADIWPSQQEVA